MSDGVEKELAAIRGDSRRRALGTVLGVPVFVVCMLLGVWSESFVPFGRFIGGGIGLMLGYGIYGKLTGYNPWTGQRG